MSIETVLSKKVVADLKDEAVAVAPKAITVTDAKVELALKGLKYQNGCSDTASNEGWIGLSDGQISSKVGITLAQLADIKAARDAKLAQLTAPVKTEPLVEVVV